MPVMINTIHPCDKEATFIASPDRQLFGAAPWMAFMAEGYSAFSDRHW
jgi:hypothetical protein